jgi:pimeloyl-ACP methyl ester carboxylesterase
MRALRVAMIGLLSLFVSIEGPGHRAGAQPTAKATDKEKEKVWEGTLNAGGIELKLVLHVTGDAGSFKATMDSPDQAAFGLKVDTVSIDKSALKFTSKNLQAEFEGKLNDEGTEAVGTWKQGGGSLPLTLKLQTEAQVAASKLVGKEDVWEGKLALPGGLSLRMVFHVGKTAGGSLRATFDSPDQGAKGLKVDSVTSDKSTLKFEMKQLAGTYVGTLNADGTEAVGDWTQGGNKMPLTLKKVDKASGDPPRPQTPKPPYPYQSVEVSYPNKEAGISLAGTLTEPTGQGPFPAVIMISGSGAQDRDETILGHKPFHVIADSLTRRGIAVLRVDDRGVGGSTGKISTSTSEDFAGDVMAGIAFLKTRPEINLKQIGLIGHSEGGIIAPMVAVKSSDVAFIILMAGTGLPGDQILQMQAKLIYESLGTKGEKLDKGLAAQAELIKIVMTENDEAAATKRMREVMEKVKSTATAEERKDLEGAGTIVDAQLSALRTKWFRFFLSYDPRPALAKVRCPVLALIGEKDLQVPPKENLAEIEKVFKKAGNTKSSARELPGLNHLFQTCKTGSPVEYAQIEETIAPSALRTMGDWITDQVRAK